MILDIYIYIYLQLVNNPSTRKLSGKLTIEEEAIFKFYTNESYYKFNQALINNSSSTDILALEQFFNSTLKKLESSPGTYFRGIGKTELDELRNLNIGDEIVYKNYLSTTSEKDIAWRFFNNNLKKTGEAAWVDVISKSGKQIDNYSDAVEWEVLHLSKSHFRLKSIEYDENYIVNLEDVAFFGAKPEKIKFTKVVIEEL